MITKTANRTRLAVSGTTYDFTFRIDSEAELEVYGIDSDGIATEITTGFSVSFDPETEDGTVTFDSEPSTYEYILMLRVKAYTQGTDIPIRGGFSESDIEDALDHIVMLIQQLKEVTDSAIKQDITDVLLDIVLPTPQDGYALAWNGTSGAMQNLAVDTAGLADSVAAAQAAQAAAVVAQAAAEAALAAMATMASQAEAEAGSNNTKWMSPLRTAQAIAALGRSFGSWEAKNAGTVYQATTDGFVLGVGNQSGASTSGLAIASDASNPPTTLRQESDAVASSGITISCMTPVRSGDYYKITSTNIASGAFFWLPIE